MPPEPDLSVLSSVDKDVLTRCCRVICMNLAKRVTVLEAKSAA